jgi:hypothetical protein
VLCNTIAVFFSALKRKLLNTAATISIYQYISQRYRHTNNSEVDNEAVVNVIKNMLQA